MKLLIWPLRDPKTICIFVTPLFNSLELTVSSGIIALRKLVFADLLHGVVVEVIWEALVIRKPNVITLFNVYCSTVQPFVFLAFSSCMVLSQVFVL